MATEADLLTPAEAATVADVPLRAVYKAMAERMPKGSTVRRSGRRLLTRTAAVCLRLDRELPKDVPLRVRRALFAAVEGAPNRRAECGTGSFRYVVDPRPAADAVSALLDAYRKVQRLIVDDPEVQGGEPTFRGTRLMVHHIADLLAQGVPISELKEDYPRLTDAMIVAAPIYVKANPRRGRPRKVSFPRRWLVSERVIEPR
jgi:uncharacterized protein (DUF433 family)